MPKVRGCNRLELGKKMLQKLEVRLHSFDLLVSSGLVGSWTAKSHRGFRKLGQTLDARYFPVPDRGLVLRLRVP